MFFDQRLKRVVAYRKLVLALAIMAAMLVLFHNSHLVAIRQGYGPLCLGREVASEVPKKALAPTPCVDPKAIQYKRVEDIFCLNIPPFLTHLKNPCFYEYHANTTTQVLKCLPYFYIIGMDKSGTTDIHNRMMLHASIRGNRGSLNKETQFWSWKRYGVFNYRSNNPILTLTNYTEFFAIFASELQRNTSKTALITGDGTPMDLWDFRSWRVIAQNFGKKEPDILTPHLLKHIYKDFTPKFIIQLREPVERLYSDYVFLGLGSNPKSFHGHVLKSIELYRQCVEIKGPRLCTADKDLYKKLPTRIHLGMYNIFIKEWLRVYPPSAFHISRTEDYKSNMQGTLKGVFSFLQVEPLSDSQMAHVVSQDQKHVTKLKKGRVLPETLQILKAFYRPFLQQTAALLKDSRFLWEDVYQEYEKSAPKNASYVQDNGLNTTVIGRSFVNRSSH